MVVDARPAVFKTVCGALLRRPGWVRFPSIPANLGGPDSQDDSYSSDLQRTPALGIELQVPIETNYSDPAPNTTRDSNQ